MMIPVTELCETWGHLWAAGVCEDCGQARGSVPAARKLSPVGALVAAYRSRFPRAELCQVPGHARDHAASVCE